MTATQTKKKRMSKLERKEAVYGYLFLLPTIVLFTIFSFVTVIMGFVYAFTNMAPGEPWSFDWTLSNFEFMEDVWGTMAIALKNFQGAYGDDYGSVMAGAVIMMIPSMLIFICGQKYFVENLSFSGIK